MPASRSSDLLLFRRLLLQARPYWGHVALLFLLSLFATPLALLTPVPLKLAVDSVIGSEPLPGWLDALLPAAATGSAGAVLLLAATLLVAVGLLKQLQKLGSSLLRGYTSERLVLEFRARLFRHAQRLSLAYHDSKGSADSTYRIQYDTSAIPHIVIDGIIPFVTAAVMLASMLYVIFRLDWQLAVVAVTVSPILFGVTRVFRPRLRQSSRRVKRLESGVLAVVQEVLSSLSIVKAFGQEEREQDRFLQRSTEGMRARLRLMVSEGGMNLLVSGTTALGTGVVLFIGIRNVLAGSLTLGELLLVMGYLSQLYDPLKTISKRVASLQSHLAGAERVFALLDREPDVVERPDALPLARARGAVRFEDVSFGYGETAVLHHVALDVPAGTRVGIIGRTGAGKTSLMRLLTRFYDPVDGRIVLDGVDLRDYRLADLRSQFSIVLQEAVLFSTSIGDNIAYARPDASEAEIVAAARAARVHDFIDGLPDGYDTLVGERGMRLSGGERQRIALARAFLKDAPILIMDEPTSSVDVKTEAGILEAMERLMQGRTTFLIAHRLGTLRHCDLLVKIEGGRSSQIDRTSPDLVEVPLRVARGGRDG
jgi:ATP-binding cassette subfamily B protein